MKNDNLKYTATSQRRFFHYFTFLLSLFKLPGIKKNHVYNLDRILHFLSFCYVMYCIVFKICIGGRFLEDYFHCYSQQIIYAIANGPLIPYNLIKGALETQNL